MWLRANSGEPFQIEIAGDKNVNDLCKAITLELQRFSHIDVDQIVIKSHEDILLARDILMSEVEGSKTGTALCAEIEIETKVPTRKEKRLEREKLLNFDNRLNYFSWDVKGSNSCRSSSDAVKRSFKKKDRNRERDCEKNFYRERETQICMPHLRSR